MSGPRTTGANSKDTNLSEQYIQNRSFDETFGVQAMELVGYDPANNVLRRIITDANGAIATTGETGASADIIAGDKNGLVTNGNSLTVPFTTATAQAVATTDASNYGSVSVHIVSQGSGSTITFQTSNDNSVWQTTTLLLSSATGSSNTVSATTSSNVYSGILTGRYFRLNVTGIISGTTAGTAVFFSQARPLSALPLVSLASGSALIGKFGIDQTTPGTTNRVVVGDTTNVGTVQVADQNGFVTNVNSQLVTFSLTGVQSANTPVPISVGAGNNPAAQLYLDTFGFQGGSAQVTLTGTGITSINFKVSNDAVTWINGFGNSASVTAGTLTSSMAVGAGYIIPTMFRYVQFQIAQSQSAATTTFIVQLRAVSVNSMQQNLGASTNIIGKFGIDQTTPGTTNAVSGNQGTAAAVTSGWPVINGELGDTTGTFTNATQTTSITTGTIDGYETALVSLTGTYGTATGVFEASDDGGTTWYTVQGARMDTGTIESGYTSLTNTTRSWSFTVPGFDSFRIRSTAVASGTVTARISVSSAPTTAAASVQIGSPLPAGTNQIGIVNNGVYPNATTLNTYSVHLTSNATTTPTSSTAYISALSISSEVGGTTSTVTIQDKQGTPLKLVNGLSTTALTTTPTTVNFQTPVKMVSGIDIITAGAVAATIDIWINYYQ